MEYMISSHEQCHTYLMDKVFWDRKHMEGMMLKISPFRYDGIVVAVANWCFHCKGENVSMRLHKRKARLNKYVTHWNSMLHLAGHGLDRHIAAFLHHKTWGACHEIYYYPYFYISKCACRKLWRWCCIFHLFVELMSNTKRKQRWAYAALGMHTWGTFWRCWPSPEIAIK